MPTIYDVIQLDLGTSWVTDGTTRNEIDQDDMTLVEPVTVTDGDGDGSFAAGDSFNGSTIVEIGKFGGSIVYDFGTTKINTTAVYVTTADGYTYLMFADGTPIEGITQLSVVAEPGGKVSPISISYLDDDDEVTIACFARGTRILTPRGEVPVDALRIGQTVTTLDRGAQPIRFLWRHRYVFTGATSRHKPILIAKDALGPGRPSRDLAVSPQHRMLLSADWLGQDAAALVPAKAMTALPQVRIKNGVRTADYVHVLLQRHEILFAEGVPTESFFPGPAVLADMGRPARQALFAACPDLRAGAAVRMGFPVRPVLRVREARDLITSFKSRNARTRPRLHAAA